MRRGLAAGFAGLCLLGGSAWLPAAYVASAWPELLRLCVHDLVVCVGLIAFGLVRQESRPAGIRLRETAACGALLFAIPPVMFAAADGRLHQSTQLLVLWLVPLFTVFAEGRRDERAMRMLTPAVLSIGGLALLVPALAWPGSAAGVGWLAGLLLVAGLVAAAGIRLHHLLQRESLVWAGAAMCGASALVAGFASALLERVPVWTARGVGVEVGWGLLIDLPLVMLTIRVLRELPPIAASSRFIWVPLVTIIGGMLLVLPAIGWQRALGLIVVAASGWVLVTGAETL